MARRRRLRPEEEALWQQIARQTTPLHPKARAKAPTKHSKASEPLADTVLKTTAPPIPPDFRVGASAATRIPPHDLAADVTANVSGRALRMDKKKHRRMRQGRLEPEARLDLHGMTAEAAHAALRGFILSSAAAGVRLALVITGKGKDRDEGGPMPARRGILRHQVPDWLSRPPLAERVLQIAPAHRSHGGSGAYYVYLRRTR